MKFSIHWASQGFQLIQPRVQIRIGVLLVLAESISVRNKHSGIWFVSHHQTCRQKLNMKGFQMTAINSYPQLSSQSGCNHPSWSCLPHREYRRTPCWD